MRSICFFMIYHGRPALTHMSLRHMYHTMWLFEEQGFEVKGLVVGDSHHVSDWCKQKGILHESFKNKPLSHKFTYTWMRAVQQDTDYICWLGSNNVHGDGYWEVCIERLKGNLCATFGTRNCVIASMDSREQSTYLFHPSEGYLISAGQFFLRHSIVNSVNLLTVFKDDQTFAFDGSIMDSMTGKWGKEIVEVVEFDEEDCIDIKGPVNIHGFFSFRDAGYPKYLPRDEMLGRHYHMKCLLDGMYSNVSTDRFL